MLRKPTAAFLIALTLAAGLVRTATAADGPTPYPDPKDEAAWPGKGPIRVFGWMVENRKYYWSQREKDQGAVVFTGDSLTQNWKGAWMAESFPGMKIANRGVGGDTSRGVLFRFKEDVLDLKPKAIVICAGANDLSSHGDPAAAESNLKEMIRMAREYKPDVPVIVCTVPPRDMAEAPAKPGAYQDINGRILKLGKTGGDFEVVDLYAALAGTDGKPANLDHFAADKLHLAQPGYKVWGEALKPVFARMGVK